MTVTTEVPSCLNYLQSALRLPAQFTFYEIYLNLDVKDNFHTKLAPLDQMGSRGIAIIFLNIGAN